MTEASTVDIVETSTFLKEKSGPFRYNVITQSGRSQYSPYAGAEHEFHNNHHIGSTKYYVIIILILMMNSILFI